MSARHPVEKSCDFPETHPYNLQQAVERFERGYIANILEQTRWNHRKTAQMLGISVDALASKMRYYQLESLSHIMEERLCHATNTDLR